MEGVQTKIVPQPVVVQEVGGESDKKGGDKAGPARTGRSAGQGSMA